jgi:LysM repeat protein
MLRRRDLFLAALAAALILLSGCSAAQPGRLTPVVTFWPTPVDPPTETAPTDPPPKPQTPILQPSPTPRVTRYTVVRGDTLWDIAVNFDVSLDEIVAANPDINPNLLHQGQVVNIPGPGVAIPQAAVTPSAVTVTINTNSARVAANASGLRLREAPSSSAAVLMKLDALTPLTILRRSADGVWFEVSLTDGTKGWVMSQYVDTGAARVVVRATAPPYLTPTKPITALAVTGGIPSYITGFTSRATEIFIAGQALGNHPNVFAVVGDSNSASPLYLGPFDAGNYDLGPYTALAGTIKYFQGSFRFTTVAAVVGFDTLRLIDPAHADHSVCGPGESPLACEYRRKRPSVALILIGTNDTGNWQNFEANVRPIIEYTIAKGIIPVLTTKGDDLEETKYHSPPNYINSIIIRLSREYGVPLLDLQQVVSKLPVGGFGSDGFHYNLPPDNLTATFTGFHMNYGYTIRNLTSLQALDAVRRLVLGN